jgi:hypothetical protein
MKYRLFLAGVFGLYLASAWGGWELFADKRGHIPPEARQQAGGYRSYQYWRGGK